MLIMCLNAWGGKLHDRLVPYIAHVNPDILCLQEVVHTPSSTQDWLTYRDGDHVLPQRANLFQEVQTALPNHTATFCPAAQGVLWDQELEVPSQWGLATFVNKAYPIIAQTQAFVHKNYAPYSYGEHPRSRNAHAIRVFDYENDRPLVVAHMHGLRDLQGKSDTPERALQARKLRKLAQDLTAPQDALVVCGDFNVEPTSETLQILSEVGLRDLVTGMAYRGTRTSYYQKAGRFADYMLVNEHTPVSDFQVSYEPEVSDHCPLLLTI